MNYDSAQTEPQVEWMVRFSWVLMGVFVHWFSLIFHLNLLHGHSLSDEFGVHFRYVKPIVHYLLFCTSILGFGDDFPLCLTITCSLSEDPQQSTLRSLNHVFESFLRLCSCFLVDSFFFWVEISSLNWCHSFEVPAHRASNMALNYDFTARIVQNYLLCGDIYWYSKSSTQISYFMQTYWWNDGTDPCILWIWNWT